VTPRVIAYYDTRYVTGRFGDPRPGRTHQGTDFSHSRTPGLTPVPALLDGTVVKVWKNDATHGYGNRVDTATAEGEVSYAHLNAPSPFRVGDSVAQGAVVGHEGKTGFVAGSCCHIEHAVNGHKRDPLPLIRDVLATPSGSETTPILKGVSNMLLFNGVSNPGQFYIGVYDGRTLKVRPTLGIEAKVLLNSQPPLPRAQVTDVELVELCRQGGYVYGKPFQN